MRNINAVMYWWFMLCMSIEAFAAGVMGVQGDWWLMVVFLALAVIFAFWAVQAKQKWRKDKLHA